MRLTRDRIRSVGWVAVLTVCGALTMGLTLRVNAVKSQVRLAERQIVSLQRQKTMLETEFETRANQQQLKALNDVEFGYQAPSAGQYLEGERQLAVLSKPRGPNAPAPIRVASAVDAAPQGLANLISSVSAKARELQSSGDNPAGKAQPIAVSEKASKRTGLDRLEGSRE